ncbi:MAG: hypothetical protein GF355_13115 [Candidatus Eisenbacteria bacterium]|nr:hypothetical protein [Candidatus Eisenbacteria bacterium]
MKPPRCLLLGVGMTVALLMMGTAAGAQYGDNFERIGAWPYGPARAVAVDDERDVIFLGSGGAVLVLDAVDPGNPALITDELRTIGRVSDLCYDPSTQRLYVAGGDGGMEIWDVSNPALPERLSITEVYYYDVETPVGTIGVYDHFAIVECAWGYVHSLDVSDPTNPVQVGFLGTMGNPARDLFVSDDGFAHATGAQKYLRMHIDENGQLWSAGGQDFTYGPDVVCGTSKYAYVGYDEYLYILDLVNPDPVPESVTNLGSIEDIVVVGDHAYVLSYLAGLRILNVSDPQNPTAESTFPLSPYYSDRVVVSGGRAYVTDGRDGLHIIDVSDPANPAEIGTYDVLSVTQKTAVRDDYAYLAHDDDGVLIVDIGDLAHPDLAAQALADEEVNDVALQGDYAFVASGNGLHTLDITSPTAPVEVGSYEGFYASDVLVDGNLGFVVEAVANEPYYLQIFDLTQVSDPLLLGTLELPTLSWGLTKSGDHIFIAAHDGGVWVVDVSEAAEPTLVDTIILPSVTEVVAESDLLYVASHDSFDGGFFIFDITEPGSPDLLGAFTETGFAPFHVAVEGEFAYVNDSDELHMILVSDPENPLDLDELTLPGDFFGVTAREELVFVSDGATGLRIIENLLFGIPGGGVGWEPLLSGTSEHLRDVYFMDESRGWFVGDDGTIRGTTDGGESWEYLGAGTTVDLFGVHFVDAATGWVVGREGTILKTTDGGDTWSDQSFGGSLDLRAVVFLDHDEGWIAGEDGLLLKTTDSGMNWVQKPGAFNEYQYDLDFVDSQHGWTSFSHDYGVIQRTEDGGESWHIVNTGSSAFALEGIDFVDAFTGWTVGVEGTILKSSDGGATWFEQEGVDPPESLTDVHFLDASRGWICGSTGRIMVTVDGGATWSRQLSGTDSRLNAIYIVGESAGYAVGHWGTVLRTQTTTGVEEGAEGTARRLVLRNSPNPFLRATTLRYHLPRSAHVRLDLFDVLGRRVATLIDERRPAGPQAVQWDGRDGQGRPVAPGVYLYRLDTRNHSAAGRMIRID